MMQHGERWVDPVELRFFADSPEAKRANELARELLTARATADETIPENQMSPLYVEASVRVFAEILAGAKTRIDRDLVIRWGYLVHALSIIAASGVWIAADLLADAEGISIDEARERVVTALAEAMEGNDQSL
jgi:hypothetical protein